MANVDSTAVTATAAALGSLLGASASIATTWLTQRGQAARASLEWNLRQRESLYMEFVAEGSRLAVDAMLHSLDRPDQLVALYGILSRIRLVSGEEVLARAEDFCRRIMELYPRPNLTADQFRAALEANEFDPLKEFSTACRSELLTAPRSA